MCSLVPLLPKPRRSLIALLFAGTLLWVGVGCVVVPNQAAPYDFDGDRVADPIWYAQDTGTWYDARTGAVVHTDPYWNSQASWAVPGDYDGDRKFEPATADLGGNWRTSGERGTFFFPPPDVSGKPSNWYSRGVVPVPGYYTDPTRTQAAWYRELDATWFIEGKPPIQFGFAGTPGDNQFEEHDIAVPADYDGDGKTDLATYNHRSTIWRFLSSRTGEVIERTTNVIGIPVPADFNGDGKTDMTVVDELLDFHVYGIGTIDFEEFDCIPVAADFTGDGVAEASCMGSGMWNRGGYWVVHGSPGWTYSTTSYSEYPALLPVSVSNNLLRVRFYWLCLQRGYC